MHVRMKLTVKINEEIKWLLSDCRIDMIFQFTISPHFFHCCLFWFNMIESIMPPAPHFIFFLSSSNDFSQQFYVNAAYTLQRALNISEEWTIFNISTHKVHTLYCIFKVKACVNNFLKIFSGKKKLSVTLWYNGYFFR